MPYWDERVEAAVRLGVRFLIRVNRMDALYAAEVARTNRIGIGPTEAEQQYAEDTGMDAAGIGGGSFTLAGAYYF